MSQKCRRVPRRRRRLLIVSCEGSLRTEMDRDRLELAFICGGHTVGSLLHITDSAMSAWGSVGWIEVCTVESRKTSKNHHRDGLHLFICRLTTKSDRCLLPLQRQC